MNETLIINSLSTFSIDVVARKVLLGCLLFSLSIFTTLGNLLVLYAIRTEKRLRTVSNLFILSLAFADLIVGIFVMPLSAANIIVGRWPFSSALCQMWLSVDYVARYVRRTSGDGLKNSLLVRLVSSISFFSVWIVTGRLFILYVIFKIGHVNEQLILLLLSGLSRFYGRQLLSFGPMLFLNIVM